MKALYVCLLVGVLALPALGAATFTNTVEVDDLIFDTPFPGQLFGTACWTHTIPGEAIGCIQTASLTIDVAGIFDCGDSGINDSWFSPNDDHVTIWLNGTSLGQLTGLQTTFSGQDVIDALTTTNPHASASILWQWDKMIDPADAAKVLTSTLEGTYACPVPAPGAVLLAGMGISLVGAFRRKRS